MTEPVRLSKRLVELIGCSRREAEQYIEGGWVLVDGQVIDEPQFKVAAERVELAADARLAPAEPMTLLLHKPVGIDTLKDFSAALQLITADSRWPDDRAEIRTLKGHFARLEGVAPLGAEASGLVVFTQDWRIVRKLTDDAGKIEQEFVVEVAGEIAQHGLNRLNHGLTYKGWTLPPAKASWQSENRLRFALKAAQPGQIAQMCAAVGLTPMAIKRLRIGGVPLAKVQPGQWRYLAPGEKF
ncbi:MAG: rRNA pseudouridine synthase [Pseudomonas sp.]|uniref:rRNA pseudouridine synthase n=1 Tax=Pseudomonas sp. TaxID=306 RepID=UPI003398A1A9